MNQNKKNRLLQKERAILEKEKLHLDSCSENFNYAWEIVLKAIKMNDHRVRCYLFEYAVVIYCRSFKATNVRGNKPLAIKKEDYVDEEYSQIHDELIKFRDKMYAHSDIKALKPDFHGSGSIYVKSSMGYPRAAMPSKQDADIIERQFIVERLDLFQKLLESILNRLYPIIRELDKRLSESAN